MDKNIIKLDIGCGEDLIHEDWIGVDPFYKGAEVKAFAWDLPYEEDTVDEIFSAHVLEHVAKRKILQTLCEWGRVLKPGRKLTLHVPDLEWCCKYWLEHQGAGWAMDILFGNQSHEGEFHKTGFNEKILREYFDESGFEVKKFEKIITHSQQTLAFECIRKEGVL